MNASMLKLLRHRPSLLAMLVPGVSLFTAFALASAVGIPRQDSQSSAPASPSAPVPPSLDSVASIKRGRAMFVRSCAHCHGDDAHGSGEDADGPDLYDLRISDARIMAVVRTGISGEMPTFAKKHSAADVRLIITYLRSLR
jgi:mono/diheme cytochrome c family protein